MKKCIICGVEKNIDDFYSHPQMADGHLNKCKDCTKMHTSKRIEVKKSDPLWVEKEKLRGRKKYHTKKYKSTHRDGSVLKYIEKYPEKQKAKISSQRVPCPDGFHKHHWSYNEEHFNDIILLPSHHHYLVHRYMVYDQERKMYRKITGELIDSKSEAVSYYSLIISIHGNECFGGS